MEHLLLPVDILKLKKSFKKGTYKTVCVFFMGRLSKSVSFNPFEQLARQSPPLVPLNLK